MDFIISGAAVVVIDMSLAMISVFFNLVVITSIRRREEMVSVTFNLVIIEIQLIIHLDILNQPISNF